MTKRLPLPLVRPIRPQGVVPRSPGRRVRPSSPLAAFLLLPLSFFLCTCVTLGQAEATCNCAGEDLQIAFLLDCSGSMNHMLGTLQEQLKRIAEVLDGRMRSFQAAVIIYRTQEYVGRQRKLEVLPFTSDRQTLADFVNSQTADGGGEELVDDALAAALEQLKWAKGARKIVVLMGDEQPVESRQPRCLLLARQLKERGIVLNAVTGSQTAWIYWAPANTTSWKQQLMDMGDDAKRVFRLPHFSELATVGGGLSVSSWNTRELLLWLLAFGLGLSEQEAQAKIDVGQFLEWSKQRDLAEAKKGAAAAKEKLPGAPLVAWVKHAGQWQVPRHFDALFEHLGERLALSGSPEPKVLGLLDADLDRYPVLYVTGHGPVKWSRDERERLKDHLQRGGFLLADACCGTPEFTASLREILKELFPDRALERLPPAHPLFSCGHRIGKVKRSEQPRSGKLESTEPELYGLELGEPKSGQPRLAVVLSPASLGCAWATRPFGVPCQYHDPDGLALTANVLVWTLTR